MYYYYVFNVLRYKTNIKTLKYIIMIYNDFLIRIVTDIDLKYF